MPRKPKRPCSFPGCPNLTEGRFCGEHEKQENRRYEKYDRDPAVRRRYGRAWKRIRDRYAAKHPFCEECYKKGLLHPVEEVHHKVILDDCRAVMDVLGDCSAIEKEMESVTGEMEVVTGLIQKLVVENATRKLNQNDYRRKYEGYVNKYAALESRMEGLKKERESREIKFDIFSGFLFELSELDSLPLEFDTKLFHSLVDYATVYHDGRMVFTFRNGIEIETKI